MIRALEELIRVLAYGGIGSLTGFWAGLLVNDRHRLATAILDEAERDMPTRRRFLTSETLRVVAVLSVMVAMLLTGLVWLQTGHANAEQDRRDCVTLREISDVLKGRTRNYREAAVAERRLWHDLSRTMVNLGAPQGGPILKSIDAYLDQQQQYLEHLRSNPYPHDAREDC